LEKTLINENFTHAEIKGRLDLGEFSLLPVQNHFYSPVLSKNIKFQIFKLKFFLLFYVSVTSCFITIKAELTLRTSVNRVPRKIFGEKPEKLNVNWRKLHKDEFHDFYSSSIIVRVIK
jgi:hypothetical protein